MRKNFVTIVTALVAALSGTINPAHAVSKHTSHRHDVRAHESHINSTTTMDVYELRYGSAYGSVIKRLIGDFDSAKMQLNAVVAASCSALRNNPSGNHPYQHTLQLVYGDIAKQIIVPRPPTFKQAMKECADIFDRTAVR